MAGVSKVAIAYMVCKNRIPLESFYKDSNFILIEYTRIVRFQKALAQMQHQAGKEINQAQIAYASGYADQSHFIREFKKFCGYTK